MAVFQLSRFRACPEGMEDGEDCHYPETREGGLYSPEGFQTDLVTLNYQ
jgi:hypothetical protein